MPEADNLRAVGDRIEHCLDELRSSAKGPLWGQVEEVLGLITELYGAALGRVVDLADPELLDRLGGDDLVASLLIVHGLHPQAVADRVRHALDLVRPYLGSHGGDVELLAVDGNRVALRMLGSCDGCPSSSVTLKLAVEKAILEAAPEIEFIDVANADEPEPPGTPVRLSRKPPPSAGSPAGGDPDWTAVEGLGELAPGASTRIELGQEPLLVCRVGGALYAYRNQCAACGEGLDGGSLDGEVLRCPSCRAAFDVRLAGRNLDGLARHLDPLPLLEDGGVVRIAVTAGARA